VKTAPSGSTKPPSDNSDDQLYKLVVTTNQVVIPVRVTDDSGRMIPGLLSPDFAVYEDGKKQPLNYFSAEPFALSAVVILDLGMPDVAVQKVNKTFSALEGAFGPYDEVALYTYSSTVGKMAGFWRVGKRLDAVLDQLKYVTAPTTTAHPRRADGSTGTGHQRIPIDPNVPHGSMSAPQESMSSMTPSWLRLSR